MKTAGKRPKKQPKIDWVLARLDYVEGRLETYAQVAEAYGAHPNTVGNRAVAENWTDLRKAHETAILQTMLDQGLKDKAKGAKALLSLQYTEAIGHARQLADKRRKNGETWDSRTDKAHAEAFEKVIGIARQALGLPKDFAPEQRTGDLAPVVVAWLPTRATGETPPDDSDE